MSDYMFNLESHLTSEQMVILTAVQNIAVDQNQTVYLTGGALRDMLGGFPIRDLDFTVEGNSLKLAKETVKKTGATIIGEDEIRKSYELQFPNGLRCEIGMSHSEKYSKPGVKPAVSPASIYDDLKGRDFTINAMALSLNRASRGLMIDPTNGAGDLETRELRTVSNYGFYDSPVRMFRLLRFKMRLGFTVNERTQRQYENAREAEVEKLIPARALFRELHQISLEPDPLAVLMELEHQNLLSLFTPALSGSKLNAAAFQKLQKTRQLIPFGAPFSADYYALVLQTLTQLLPPKEKARLVANTKMERAEADPWQKLETRAKKLESVIKSARLSKASQIYNALKTAKGEEILYLVLNSNQRLVQDRLKNYFSKYLQIAIDVTDAEVTEATGLEPGNPKFQKAKDDRISAHLDGRIRKPVVPPEPEPPPPPPPGRGPMIRSARLRQA